jgi:hypothetical protein
MPADFSGDFVHFCGDFSRRGVVGRRACRSPSDSSNVRPDPVRSGCRIRLDPAAESAGFRDPAKDRALVHENNWSGLILAREG